MRFSPNQYQPFPDCKLVFRKWIFFFKNNFFFLLLLLLLEGLFSVWRRLSLTTFCQMHSERCLLTVWPVFTWWTFFAYLLLGMKNQPVQRKCLFCQLHSLEFIFLEVIANSTVNLERTLTNCNARGREMTERAKETSRGVSSLRFLSSLTTSFLGACLLYA